MLLIREGGEIYFILDHSKTGQILLSQLLIPLWDDVALPTYSMERLQIIYYQYCAYLGGQSTVVSHKERTRPVLRSSIQHDNFFPLERSIQIRNTPSGRIVEP